MVDLWDTDNITQEEGEQFQEDLEELSKEDLETRKEVIKHYISVYKSLDTDGGKVVYDIQKQVSDLLLFSDISHVPTFLNEKEEYTRIVKEKVTVEGVPKEEIDKLIDSELNRYTSVINDFIPVIKKDDQYYIDDWKVGIKVVDFMVRDVKFPQYLVLLTDRPLDELVNAMAEGYLPPVLQHTPFKKVLKMFETMAKDIESKSSGLDYQFKKAYKEYKKRLPLYTRLRNNGNFPSINAVLKDFYNTIDNAHINNSYNGDAFLGLIEPKEFISAYTRFFYGNAKQTQAMKDVIERIMKQNPNVILNMTESNYTLADVPEGAFIVFAGHIVTYLPYKNGEYISTIDKAPSNIIGEDIKTLANMVSKGKKKTKKETKKVEPKKEPVVEKDAGGFKGFYDHEGAIKMFEDRKNNPTPKKKENPKKKVEPEPEEEIEPEVEEEVKETELVEEEDNYVSYEMALMHLKRNSFREPNNHVRVVLDIWEDEEPQGIKVEFGTTPESRGYYVGGDTYLDSRYSSPEKALRDARDELISMNNSEVKYIKYELI